MISTNKELAHKLEQLERKIEKHNEEIVAVPRYLSRLGTEAKRSLSLTGITYYHGQFHHRSQLVGWHKNDLRMRGSCNEVVANCDHIKRLKFSPTLAGFTETWGNYACYCFEQPNLLWHQETRPDPPYYSLLTILGANRTPRSSFDAIRNCFPLMAFAAFPQEIGVSIDILFG